MPTSFVTPENITKTADLIIYADMYTDGMIGLIIPLMIFTIVFSVSTFTLKPLPSGLVAGFITLVFAIWFSAIGIGSSRLIYILVLGLIVLSLFSFWKRTEG